jgi:hypothetical protein
MSRDPPPPSSLHVEPVPLMVADMLVCQKECTDLMPFEAAALDMLSLCLSDQKVLICSLCKEAVHCKQAHQHAQERHDCTIKLGAKTHFDHVIASLMTQGLLQAFRFGPRPPSIPGFGNLCQERYGLKEPIPGYRCLYDNTCNHARIREHQPHEHSSEHIVAAHVQSFFHDASAVWFPTIDPSPPSSTPPSNADRGLAALDQILQRPMKSARVHKASTFRDRNKLIEVGNWHNNFADLVTDQRLIELVGKLLQLPSNDLNSKDADGFSPIRYAAKSHLKHVASYSKDRNHALPYSVLTCIGRDLGYVFIQFWHNMACP